MDFPVLCQDVPHPKHCIRVRLIILQHIHVPLHRFDQLLFLVFSFLSHLSRDQVIQVCEGHLRVTILLMHRIKDVVELSVTFLHFLEVTVELPNDAVLVDGLYIIRLHYVDLCHVHVFEGSLHIPALPSQVC